MLRPAFALLTLTLFASIAIGAAAGSTAAARPRARDLGVPFDGTPGPLNAITDVEGVLVGHTTLISGTGKLVVGKGPIRTGVTAVLPRGTASMQRFSFAGWFSENGNGEMTGTTWVEESGFLDGPVMITNTHSVGVVRDAVVAWRVAHGPPQGGDNWWSLPVVAETWDGWLNDINGFHVKPEHVFHAIDSAHAGAVEEGSVGGGTGMICNGFKGGIGTSSRQLADKDGGYRVGVLVQCNYGTRQNLRIAGIPVGREIESEDPYAWVPSELTERGSIIVVVATNAPLLPHQLKRIARRVTLGIGRNGSIAGNGSGDIFIAFSTANPGASELGHVVDLKMVPNDSLDPLFAATVQATEEAIVNAMVAAEDMTGIDGHHVRALPHDELRAVLAKYHRLMPAAASANAAPSSAAPSSAAPSSAAPVDQSQSVGQTLAGAGDLIARYDGYRSVETNGPDCKFPGFGNSRSGSFFEIREHAVLWGQQGHSPDVLWMSDIQDVPPPVQRFSEWVIPIKRRDGSCAFFELFSQGSSSVRAVQDEARSRMLGRLPH
jgi:L-aminopeptidase/D-esterase-like protein